MSGADGFSKDWTDLPGDNIGRLYIMEEPDPDAVYLSMVEPAWAAFERLQRRRREGRFANPIDYEAVRRLQEARMKQDVHPNVQDFITAVMKHLLDTYGPRRKGWLPAGLRLEMHPTVNRRLMTDEKYYTWPGEMSTREQLLVKVTTDVPPGTWRLVIVVEDVLLGGRL
jgi:hypothetical protein